MQAGCFLPENLDFYAAAIDFREQMTVSQVDRGDASDPVDIGLSKKSVGSRNPYIYTHAATNKFNHNGKE